ncbi:MAG: DeoR/GlpR transcriptional regulator [Planctomycetes bacterium]|nr:DeoR/GlpR transcriptional regulator [Planctomycetota bacterium]
MLAAERHDRLVNLLRDKEFLAIDEACTAVGASPATIRRDFGELVAQGRVERLRGGITRPRRDALAMVPFAAREMHCAAEKSAIARLAAGLLAPGDAVFVDGGTSTLHLASHLGAVPARVITNSLRLAAAIGATTYASPVEVHCTGGYLLARGGLLIGPQARAGIAAYHARWAFLSVGGVGPDGVFNTDELVQDVEREMIAHADRVVVLADHTKIGARSLCRVCDMARVHELITDAAAEPAVIDAIRRAGVAVRVA